MTADSSIVIDIKGRLDGGRRIKGTLDDISKSGDKAVSSVDRLDKKSKTATRSMTAFGKAFSLLAVGSVLTIMSRTTDEFLLLDARVKNSTRSIQEFEEATESLRRSAAETGADYATSVEIFQRISFVRDEINATNAEMLKFTDNVQKLGVVSGASTQGLNAGLRQLGQSLSSEIVRAEEFNSIMENIPAVGKAIADELEVSTGQLRQLVISGELLSSDVFAAILNQTQEVNAQFEKFPVTIGRAVNELTLKLKVSAGEFDKLTNSTQILVEGLRIVGNILESLVGLMKGFGNTMKAFFSLVIAGIIDAFNTAARRIEDLTNFIIDSINKINPGNKLENVDFASDISRSDLASTALETAAKEIESAKEGFKDAFESATEIFIRKEGDATSTAIEETTQKISKDYSAIAKTLSKSNTKIDKEALRAAERIKDVTSELEFNLKQLERNNTEQEVYNNLKRASVAIDTEAGQRIKDLTEEYERMSDKLAEQERIAETTAQTFTDFFEDSVTGAKSFKNALGDLAGELGQFILQLTVLDPLKNTLKDIFSSTGSIKSASGGGFSFGNILGSVGSLFGFNSGGSMILGGNQGVDNNVLSLNGAPIARTGYGETLSISPNKTGGGAGIVVNQTINVSTGVQETVQAEIVQLMPQIRESTQAAIQESQLRGIS